MRILFSGWWNPWVVLGLAILGAGAAWWLYRRETRVRARGPIRWLLPLLRAIVVFVIVALIARPVLRRDEVQAEPGRIRILVDGSGSMAAADPALSVGEKLRIARARGRVSDRAIDFSLSDLADALGAARTKAAESQQPGTTAARLQRACEELRAETAAAQTKLRRLGEEQLPGGFLQRFIETLAGPAAELARGAAADQAPAAIRPALAGLLGSAAALEQELRAHFASRAAQLSSTNPAIADAVQTFDKQNRWERAGAALLGKEGALAELSARNEVELALLPGLTASQTVWESAGSAAPLGRLPPLPGGDGTDLASVFDAAPAGGSIQPGEAGPRAAVVLFSDGRHNAGAPPVDRAQALREQNIPVHTVALGHDRPRPDLAVLAVQHPKVLAPNDRLQGTIDIHDSMPPGQEFAVRLELGNEVLWEQKLVATGAGDRRVAFGVSLREAVARAKVGQGEEAALAIELSARIVPVAGEEHTGNNAIPLLAIKSPPLKARILLVDSRPRWETRYLSNLFTRDRNWQVNALLLAPGETLKSGANPGTFPADRATLFNYDLLVLGDLSAELLGAGRLEWIRDFVTIRGGGVILIDGPRHQLRSLADTPAAELLPVRWTDAEDWLGTATFQLTDAGAAASFLSLTPGGEENRALWVSLPAPRRAGRVEPLPGAESLVKLVTAAGESAAFVGRRAGAGRVLFSASDESWRWRYNVADEYHLRFWNQAALWAMEPPFAANDARASIDSDALVVVAGRPLALRARLRDEAGQPVFGAAAEAVVQQDGRDVATVRLGSLEGLPVLRGVAPDLPPGRYAVRLRSPLFPNGVSDAALPLIVLSSAGSESAMTAANPALLRDISARTGGTFLTESESGRLAALLAPLRREHLTRRENPIWKSWWIFAPLVLLASTELLLRKRNGLL